MGLCCLNSDCKSNDLIFYQESIETTCKKINELGEIENDSYVIHKCIESLVSFGVKCNSCGKLYDYEKGADGRIIEIISKSIF